MMTKHTQKIGKWGEGIAAAYLQGKGYLILDRNVYSQAGEIDIVASREEDGESILIFVEVKTRTNDRFGYPEDAFTRRKWNHLLGAINNYLERHPNNEDEWRVDVIAIQRLHESEPPDIQHFENVVMTDGPT